jgi:hypothetical protein
VFEAGSPDDESEEDVRESMRANMGRTYEGGQVAELVTSKNRNEGGEVAFGTTAEQYLNQYENTMLRQIVLVFNREQYVTILSRLAVLRRYKKVETNAQAVVALLDHFFSEHPDLEKEAEDYEF